MVSSRCCVYIIIYYPCYFTLLVCIKFPSVWQMLRGLCCCTSLTAAELLLRLKTWRSRDLWLFIIFCFTTSYYCHIISFQIIILYLFHSIVIYQCHVIVISMSCHIEIIIISRYVDSLQGLCQSSTDFIQGNHRQQSLLAIYLASYLNATSSQCSRAIEFGRKNLWLTSLGGNNAQGVGKSPNTFGPPGSCLFGLFNLCDKFNLSHFTIVIMACAAAMTTG